MALFCDFENVALGVRESRYQQFDISKVLERLLLKGSIVVKKAYCDWERYREFKAAMHQASFELIEIPHVRMSGKNSADIRMVVDALDLCYTKSHVDTFVIISGDSDFSPLVSKLRENNKTVIGVGVKNSTSDLLIANCDEFIYYDDLVRDQRPSEARAPRRRPAAAPAHAPGRGAPQRAGGTAAGAAARLRASASTAPAMPAASAAPQVAVAVEAMPAVSPQPQAEAQQSLVETVTVVADQSAAKAAPRRGRRKAAPDSDATVDAAASVPAEAASAGAAPAPAPAAIAAESTGASSTSVETAKPKAAPRRRGSRKAAADAAEAAETAGSELAETAAVDVATRPAVETTFGGELAPESAPDSAEELSVSAAPPDADASAGDAGLVADEGLNGPAAEERTRTALELVVSTIEALAAERGEDEKIWGSMVKQTLRRRRPGFNENYYGFRSFNRLLEEARDRGLIELELDDKSGGYTVRSLA